MEQINNNGYQMFLDTDSVFAPQKRGQERRAQQNALARQQAVRNALAQSINPQTGVTNYEFARQIGGVDIAPELQAAQQADLLAQTELRGKQATTDKNRADAAKTYNDVLLSHLQTMGGLIGAAVDEPTYQLNKQKAASMGYDVSELPEHFDAGYVSNLQKRTLTVQQQLERSYPKLEMADLGATKQPYNPYTGKPVGNGMAVSLSPDEQSRQNREYYPGKVAHVTTDDQGNVRFWNAQGGEVNSGAGQGAGKPSGAVITARQKAEQLRKDIDTTITEFRDILKPGGLLDKSTGSGAGAMVDAAAGFIGKATEGSIAIGQLQPIADLSLKLVPRFEGPQSDADTKSYKEASANVANPKLPVAVRKAAAATVLRILEKRRSQFGPNDGSDVVSGAPSAPAAPAVGTIEDGHSFKGGNPADPNNWVEVKQ
jgi:hypothetical protein